MFIGIEIGGTKLQLGLGRGDGQLLGLWRGTVDASAGGEGIRRQITAAVPELLTQANSDRAEIRGVSIGFGGPVDDATHTVIKSHQIRGWDGFPLADWVADLLGVPAVLSNDADVAGLGEALFGAGKGLSPVFYMTIGSGIGGGLILNGQIYRGCGRGAAEIGHLRVPAPSRPGEELTLEAIASGWGIEKRASGTGHRQTVRRLAELARTGHTDAQQILAEAVTALADAISQMITLLCPARIVIGGGVSLIGEDLLFGPLRAAVAEKTFPPFAGLTDIVPAALGEEVVIHGALALARQSFGR